MVLVLKGTVERNGPKFVSFIIIVVQMGRTLLSKSAVNGMHLGLTYYVLSAFWHKNDIILVVKCFLIG